MARIQGRAPPKGAPIVLAVDNDADALVTLERTFRKLLPNVHLITAESGADGLALLARNPVDLALVDYRMPGMDGLEFLDEAHRARPRLRSIMVTGYPDPALAKRATRAGCSLVIAKPFETAILAGAVDYMLEHMQEEPAVRLP